MLALAAFTAIMVFRAGLLIAAKQRNKMISKIKRAYSENEQLLSTTYFSWKFSSTGGLIRTYLVALLTRCELDYFLFKGVGSGNSF